MEAKDKEDESKSQHFLPGYKTVNDFVQEGFSIIMSATRWSNKFPTEQILPGYDDSSSGYKTVFSALQNNASELFKDLLEQQKAKSSNIGQDFELLPDFNDVLVDSLNKDLTNLEAGNTEEEQPIVPENYITSTNQASWNVSPVVCSLQMGKTKMLAAKNIERPQVSFKDKVDNSTKTLWVPKITEKPNCLKPLALMLIYNDEGDTIGYVHPYEVELRAFAPLREWMNADGLGLLSIRPLEETPLTYVSTLQQLQDMIEHLKTVREIAVDVEHHSYRTYQGITCLVQLSTEEGGDFLVDTLTLREHLQILNEVFTNPKILKVLHGAESDIVWLQRDLGVYVVGMFDTYHASVLLKLPRNSLSSLTERYCEVSLEKKYQLADWRMRPLPDELREYARCDTHYLLYIWRRMRKDLLDAAQGSSNLLKAAFDNSTTTCGKVYVKPVFGEDLYMNLYLKSKKHFNGKQLTALKGLYEWRDGVGRLEDESASYVLPNHMLLQIAENLPREIQGLLACCNPIPPLLKRNLLAVHQIVLQARQASTENVTNRQNSSVSIPMPSAPSLILCVHDRLEDRSDREVLQSNPNGGGPMKRPRKKHNRKPWSFETPPQMPKGIDLSSVTKRFVPPYERLLLVKEYKESIASHEE